MKSLWKERIRILADRNGWPLARAEGYIDGETCRRQGRTPSTYVQVGIDEYSLGFRAAYYERKTPSVTRSRETGPIDRAPRKVGKQ